MIRRTPIIPNAKADKKLCLILAQAILRDESIQRTADYRIEQITQQIAALTAELTTLKAQQKPLADKIVLLRSLLKTFHRDR